MSDLPLLLISILILVLVANVVFLIMLPLIRYSKQVQDNYNLAIKLRKKHFDMLHEEVKRAVMSSKDVLTDGGKHE